MKGSNAIGLLILIYMMFVATSLFAIVVIENLK